MFNVSIKITSDQLSEITQLTSLFSNEYQSYLKVKFPLNWVVYYTNFQDFRVQAANKLFSKHLAPQNKSFKMSINANIWLSLQQCMDWIFETNSYNHPYTEAIYRDIKNSATEQINYLASLTESKNT